MSPTEAFELLARLTWRTVGRAHRRRVAFGEDAITSVNLLALAQMHHGSVVVEDVRSQESTKGCDFELWVGGDAVGWRRYALQAKKIAVSSGRYDKLRHRVGAQEQVDVLDKYAKACGAAPLYCFYNYREHDDGSGTPWSCTLPTDREQLGCTVTPSKVVRDALASRGCRTFSWIHTQPETLPWRCLVHCPMLIEGGSEVRWPRWPRPQSHFHELLPPAIARLRERPSDSIEIEQTVREPTPKWIAIVDITLEGEG